MKGIEFKFHQGSPEWHEARRPCATGSEIHTIIMRTERALKDHVRKELGLPGFAGNAATRYGHEAEPLARVWYAVKTGKDVRTCGFFVRPEDNRLGSSPDGLTDDDNRVVEFKCPFTGGVPTKPKAEHVAQVRWNMFVTGAEFADIVYWVPDGEPAIFPVEQDESWLVAARVAAVALLDQARTILDDDPKAWLESNEGSRNDAAWVSAALEFAQAKAALAEAEDAVAQAKDRLLVLAGNTDCGGAGVRVSWVERKGNVAWTKLAKKHGIPDDEVESYRGPPTRYARVSADD